MTKTIKEPSIYKTKAYKDLMEELGKPPKVKITARFGTPEDKKKAKLMQKIVNSQFENNTNGFTTRYFKALHLLRKKWAESYLYGTKVTVDTIEKIAKEATGFIDLPRKIK